MSEPVPDDPDAQRRLEAVLDGRSVSAAAFAPNWKTVLLVDVGVGVALAVIGVVLSSWIHPWFGWPVVLAGAVYVALVGRRWLQWRYLRREAGL